MAIRQPDTEDNDQQLPGGEGPGPRAHNPRRGDQFYVGRPRSPALLQRVCSTFRLSLLVLGFNILLLVAICVIGSQRTQLQEELRVLKENFTHFSNGVLSEISTLLFHGGSAGQQLTSLEAKLEKQQKDLKADHAALLLHVKHFPVDLRILTCQMAFLRSNGTQCCPVNWLEYEGSCYWFSHSGKTWADAERYCRLESAHLVVINSREEQKFIMQHTNPFDAWIGLTDSDGSWKWVDGTDYEQSYKNWAATQPDDWQGHEVGGGEDCAELRTNGRWNDNFCKQVFQSTWGPPAAQGVCTAGERRSLESRCWWTGPEDAARLQTTAHVPRTHTKWISRLTC
ncbi:asialoglycoprotein receptor 2-like isoform X1 [Mustela lutreola]|uniref:asialoglycoprotein receptor 2-like isoform X1 n=1 Tax=Mustela lutreola TaxID=9666 RepID=UPI00279779BC|nr:asialoglycoprotein receptor 2-like isoform X1 [Mustela lutreola]XP_059004298.1 asialoglycoprotein receptor 2-like isoform X1 [Mustela lutreola]